MSVIEAAIRQVDRLWTGHRRQDQEIARLRLRVETLDAQVEQLLAGSRRNATDDPRHELVWLSPHTRVTVAGDNRRYFAAQFEAAGSPGQPKFPWSGGSDYLVREPAGMSMPWGSAAGGGQETDFGLAIWRGTVVFEAADRPFYEFIYSNRGYGVPGEVVSSSQVSGQDYWEYVVLTHGNDSEVALAHGGYTYVATGGVRNKFPNGASVMLRWAWTLAFPDAGLWYIDGFEDRNP